MTKHLDEAAMQNELSTSAFFQSFAPKPSAEPPVPGAKPSVATPPSNSQSTNQSIDRSVDQSTREVENQSSGGPVDRSTQRPAGRVVNPLAHRMNRHVTNRVVDRPKAFYITERLNEHIDDAVRYFQQQHGIRKMDRSAVINVLLDNEANWTEEALDLVLDRVLSELASRLRD